MAGPGVQLLQLEGDDGRRGNAGDHFAGFVVLDGHGVFGVCLLRGDVWEETVPFDGPERGDDVGGVQVAAFDEAGHVRLSQIGGVGGGHSDINKTSTMDYSFTYRQVKASDIQISPVSIPLLSLPVRVGEPGLSYIRNTRDNDLDPTKGMYIAGTAGVAESHFGSETEFSHLLIQNATYHAFGKNRPQDKKFVFARRTTIGVENAFGNTSILPPGQACPVITESTCANLTVIPLAERFLSGGGNSLRGFGLNQAGPRDPVTGFPLGGSGLLINNTELRLPPISMPYVHDNMSFALFWDAGNVFTSGSNMLNNLLRWSQKNPSVCLQDSPAAKQCDFSYISHALGVGVRYKTPVGPVRFDFGYNLNPPAFPSCEATPNFIGQVPSAYCTSNSIVNNKATLPYFLPQHAPHFNVYFSIGQSF